MIDYTKPGKTPPGTQHPRPPRRERRTWHDIVAPHPDHIPPGDRPDPLDQTASFTAPVPIDDPRSRRERRAESRRPAELLTQPDVPVVDLIQARKQRRVSVANRARRQRKGQRRFMEQQRLRAFRDDTVRAQMQVLAGPDSPRRRNVYNGLVAKYGDQIQEMAAAQ